MRVFFEIMAPGPERGWTRHTREEGLASPQLRPVPAAQLGPRPFGLCAGVFVVPDDFDSPLPEEILRGFEER